MYTEQQEDEYLNDFACRSFRDVADQDYIAARMAYRARLLSQFLWSSLQAIEKYLKCILLLNRVKADQVQHDLGKALDLIDQHALIKLPLSDVTRKFIEHLDTYARFRYLETPYHVGEFEIVKLDRAVWEIRRHCMIIFIAEESGERDPARWIARHDSRIKTSDRLPPHAFRLPGGVLETIIKDRQHPARPALIWRNLFYGSRSRKAVALRRSWHATNSPLSMRPELLDLVLKYVFLPGDVKKAYREEIEHRKRRKQRS